MPKNYSRCGYYSYKRNRRKRFISNTQTDRQNNRIRHIIYRACSGFAARWLNKHEGGGRGHTLSHHVGRPIDYLRKRAQKPLSPDKISTFFNQTVAENIIAQAIIANIYQIDQWLRQSPHDRLELSFVASHPVGVVLCYPKTEPEETSLVTIVLQKLSQRQTFFVLVAYPKKL